MVTGRRKKRIFVHAHINGVRAREIERQMQICRGSYDVKRIARRQCAVARACLVLVVHGSIRAAGTSRFSPPLKSEGTTAA